MTPVWLKTTSKEDEVEIKIYAQPGAKHSELIGEFDGYLKIKISSPPVDGLANEQLRAWIALKLGIGARSITLIRGQTSRRKVFLVSGVTAFDISEKLHV